MSSDETPALSTILISTFIEQCSQPFDCGMQPILDSFGKTNTVFCEDGFAYLSPDPPDEITYPKFNKVIEITASSDENQPNQNNQQNEEQNNSQPNQEDDQQSNQNSSSEQPNENQNNLQENDQQSNQNDTTEQPNENQNNSQEDDQQSNQNDASKQPNENQNNEENLQSLTNELKSLTEKVADIKIDKFVLQWGLSDNSVPYLIACNELSYEYSEELNPYIEILPQILLFIAYEGVLPVEAGRCITPNKKCVGAQMTINRQKFEIAQIQKHFSSIVKKLSEKSKSDDNKPEISLDKLGNYIIKRLIALFPQAMMSSVPCCRNCFGFYSRASFSSHSKPTKKQQTMNGTNSRLSQTRGSLTSTKRSKERNQKASSMKNTSTSNQLLKTQMPTTKPKSQFEPFQKTKSGLTVIQNVSQKTYMKSINVYSEEPLILEIKK